MKTLIALLFLVCSGLAQALPEAVRKAEAGWRQWGSGEMSWLGFSLYRATLWVVGVACDGGCQSASHGTSGRLKSGPTAVQAHSSRLAAAAVRLPGGRSWRRIGIAQLAGGVALSAGAAEPSGLESTQPMKIW